MQYQAHDTLLLRQIVTLTAAITLAPVAVAGAGDTAQNWPQWRGPLGTGVAPDANPPVQWSEVENVRFKVALPGRGHSTPIIWGGRVFITTAVPIGEPVGPFPDRAPGGHDNLPVTHRHRFVAIALSRTDGKVLWHKTLGEQLPHEGGHVTGSLASASPVADDEHLFTFLGSRGLYCLDHDGNVLWQKDLGKMQTLHGHGEGSSPVLHGETLVVNWDHEGRSFVVALDKSTGKQRWKVARDEVTSWATPIFVEHRGKPQVVISGTGRVRGYDLATGRVIWQCGGLSRNVVASPVAGQGMVYAGSSYDIQAMLAIRLDGAAGDITGTDQIAWTRHRLTPYVPSPLLYGNTLYFLRHYQGILSCVDGPSGRDLDGPLRLGGIRNVYASPVGAANRVYITDRSGTTLVISHGGAPKALALNRLNDRFSASAAVVGDAIYLRGERWLYCLAED